jgi:hypothetical protein
LLGKVRMSAGRQVAKVSREKQLVFELAAPSSPA